MVVSFYNKERKRVVVSIDFASDKGIPKNYKYLKYMNGYNEGYYNIIVTQYQPDDLSGYLSECEIIYDKKKMNGRYQVGSGRVVAITHDTPFINNSIRNSNEKSNEQSVKNTKSVTPTGKASLKNLGEASADVGAFESGKLKELARKKVSRKHYKAISDAEISFLASSLEISEGDLAGLRRLFREACADASDADRLDRFVSRALSLAVIDAQKASREKSGCFCVYS